MTQASGTPARVLVVDDEVKFSGVMREFLRARGYEVAVANTSHDALRELEAFRPEVVLMDIIMPGLSGLELLKLVRERAFPPRVIMVTATDEEQVAQQAMQDGAEAFMVKPVNFEALVQVISRVYRTPQPPAA